MRPILSIASYAHDFALLAMGRTEHENAVRQARIDAMASHPTSLTRAARLAEEARLRFASGQLVSAVNRIREATDAMGDRRPAPSTAAAAIWRDLGIYALAAGDDMQARLAWRSIKNVSDIEQERTQKAGLEALQLTVYMASELGCQQRDALRYQKLVIERSEHEPPQLRLQADLLAGVLESLNGNYSAARRRGLQLLESIEDLYPTAPLCRLVISIAIASAEIGLDRFSDAAIRLRNALAALDAESSWATSLVTYAKFITRQCELNTPAGCALEDLMYAYLEAIKVFGPNSPTSHNIELAYLETLPVYGRAAHARGEISTLAGGFLSEDAINVGIRSQWQFDVAQAYMAVLLVGTTEAVNTAVRLGLSLRKLVSELQGKDSVPSTQVSLDLAAALVTLSYAEESPERATETAKFLFEMLERSEEHLGREHPLTWEVAAVTVRALVSFIASAMLSSEWSGSVTEVVNRYKPPRKAGPADDYNPVTKGDLAWRVAIAEYNSWSDEDTGVQDDIRAAIRLSDQVFGSSSLYSNALRADWAFPDVF